MLYDSDDETPLTEIVITPPVPNVLTDEDSADEDGGGLVDNLSRHQLNAQAEVRLAKKVRKVRVSQKRTKKQKKKKQSSKKQKSKRPTKTWIDGDFEKTTTFIPSKNFDDYSDLSPIEIFETLFSDNIFDHILNESRKYALFLNCKDPCITKAELKCFFAILIFSGYHILPGKKMYWETARDMGNRFIIDSMRRDRFVQIMRFIHCADNAQMDVNDKMWKLRPAITMLQNNFKDHFIATEHMNYDESMVKYFGRHGCKQFIRGKPIRFGYKIWCLNAENGYLVDFDIYQGKGPNSNAEYDLKYGKAAAPLVQMLDRLPEPNMPYQIYIDNLFTGFNLLKMMRERGYGITGTIRQNRLPKDCPLPLKKELMKKDRGFMTSKISKDDGIFLVKWKDNAVVSMASTSYGIEPISNVSRYSQTLKRSVQVARPHVIGMYNKYMGGTDRMDEDLARNRIGIRSKKWYWPLFTWLIDAAIQNSWTLYKSSGRSMTNLNFRRMLVTTYLIRYGQPPKRFCQPKKI